MELKASLNVVGTPLDIEVTIRLGILFINTNDYGNELGTKPQCVQGPTFHQRLEVLRLKHSLFPLVQL
jgi:hypothetical protein